MSAAVSTTGAEGPRLPSAHLEEPPRAVALLLASWVILLQGALIVIFVPVLVFTTKDVIPPERHRDGRARRRDCLTGGGLVYLPRRWSWWLGARRRPSGVPPTSGRREARFGPGGLRRRGAQRDRRRAARPRIARGGQYRGAGAGERQDPLPGQGDRRLDRDLPHARALPALSELDFGVHHARSPGTSPRASSGRSCCRSSRIVLAIILALFGALGRLSTNPIAYGVSGFYASFFRGTPLIVQLFLIYLALPADRDEPRSATPVDFPHSFDGASQPVVGGILALGFNYGAYMTEIFRAGIQSVGAWPSRGRRRARHDVPQKMRRVVLPQAFRVIIPPTGNEFIAMMKDTALVSLPRRRDLLRPSSSGARSSSVSADFKNLEALLVAAALYWALTAVFTFFQRRLETTDRRRATCAPRARRADAAASARSSCRWRRWRARPAAADAAMAEIDDARRRGRSDERDRSSGSRRCTSPSATSRC